MAKIETKDVPKHEDIKAKPKKEGRVVFSFAMWNQLEHFGCDKEDTKWFISLLDRIKHLSSMSSNYIRNSNGKSLRYHEVSWEQKNIPIKKEDLNLEESPLYQINISQGKGRIIGQWYENIFYILLLDPRHNMQPSKDYNYKIDKCSPLSNQYEYIHAIVKNECEDDCEKKNKILCPKNSDDIHYLSFSSKDKYENIKKLLEESGCHLDDAIEHCIISHYDKKNGNAS